MVSADADASVRIIIYSHSRYPNPNWSQSHAPRSEIYDCKTRE